MLRKPCGPPSHRHQISGLRSAPVRSRVIPASANRSGRRAGRPATSRRRRRPARRPACCPRRPRPRATSPAGRSRASPSASSDGQRFGAGASRTSARPSSPSPWRGGRSRWSSRAARAVGHRGQALARRPRSADARPPAPRPPRPARARPRSTDSPRPAPGRCRTGTCCGPAPAPAAARPRAASARSRGTRGTRRLATSCPAASAITWLLADEPRLRKPARYCWCQRICATASSLSLEQRGRPAASRRAGGGSRRS